jgi:carboxylesterase
MNKHIICSIVILLTITFVSCNPTPEIEDSMLDSGKISFALPDSLNRNLVSRYIANPTNVQKETPVIIAAHGYTATTFEWEELRAYADSAKTFYVSQVLLGGHGRSYEAFKAASWQDWQSSIIEEYIKLSDLGFKKIYLAGSSTGAPLILQMLKSGLFSKHTNPKGFFLVDPIVVSSNKTLTLVGLLGPVLGYTTVELDNGEVGKWYVYRPQETLKELMKLIDLTRRDLENGITVSGNFYMKVYKSSIDETADPVSAVMIYKGIKYEPSLNKNIDIEMVDSKIHVFTRLKGRPQISNKDKALQHKAFAEMEAKMKQL